MGLADTARLAATLDLDGNFSRNLGAAQKQLSSFGKSAGQIGKGAGQALGGIAKIGAVAAGAAVTGLVAAAKAAGDFEAQLNTINTIARSDNAMAAYGEGIRQVARDTGTPLEDLTKAYYDLLSAGIKTADAQKVLTSANTLAIGGLATTAETVDLLTTAINVYGGDASKATQFTDEFAKAIERGKVTAAELASNYAQVAPLAKSLGIENKELAAGFARLTAGGTLAGEAATQMASAMTALLKKTPDLEKLEKATKKNYAAIAGSKGLNVALQEMQKDAGKAGIQLVDLVGRKEALLYILQTTGANLEKYNEDLAAMGDSAGTAAAQMSERQQGLNFQLGRLGANAKDALISIGGGLLPGLTKFADKLSQFLTDNRGELEGFGKDIGKALEGIDFDALLNSLKGVAGTFKNDVLPVLQAGLSLFGALPGPVKGLAGSLAVLSQTPLLGGAVGQVGKGLGNIAIGGLGLLGGGLSKILPGKLGAAAGGLSRLTAQPVFVTNWPLGGLGGGVPGVGGKPGAGGLLTGAAVAVAGAAVFTAIDTFQQVNAASTKQAEDIQTKLKDSLASPNTVTDLQTKLSAIDSGIREIRANPLLALVQGDALTTLQNMRTEVASALAIQTAAVTSADQQERAAHAIQAAQAQSSGAALAQTIRDKDWRTTVTVNSYVNVSATIRDRQIRERSASSYGFMIGGK